MKFLPAFHFWWQLALESFGDQKPMDIWGYRPGDQWVFTMVCMNNPEKCGTLPKIWNLSGCAKPRFLGLNARDRDQVGGRLRRVNTVNLTGTRARTGAQRQGQGPGETRQCHAHRPPGR